MTFSVYRKVFLVFKFDTECLFWTQIRHRMSSRSDISGQYSPDYDISGQATRNAFRESPEMSFLVKKNIFKIIYFKNLLLGSLAEIMKLGPIWLESACWELHSLPAC